MRVSNGAIWQAREPLQELLKQPWQVKTSYALVKMAKTLNEQYGIIEQVRVKLIQQYGAVTARGYAIVPESSNWAPFVEAYNELMSEEVDLSVEPVKLPADSDIQVTPVTLQALEPFVEVADVS